MYFEILLISALVFAAIILFCLYRKKREDTNLERLKEETRAALETEKRRLEEKPVFTKK